MGRHRQQLTPALREKGILVKLDWDAGHGPVSGPVNCALTALTVGWAGNVYGMPPMWAAGAAGCGWLGTHIAGVRKQVTGTTLLMRAAAWLGVGGWCSYAIAASPWTHWSLGTLAAGALGLGTGMVGAHHVEEKAAEKKAAADVAAKRASLDAQREGIAKEWEERITRICNGAVVHVAGVELWDSDGGFTLDVECSGGTRWKDINACSDTLAADAKLPEGCGVEAGPGTHRGAALVSVATVNRLIGEEPYPDDYSPLSLKDPSPHGVHRDGTLAAPVMRERSGVTSGRRGSGKTNLMNVKIANQCRMVDNLVWVIDLNGGGLALAWLRAWHAAGRPGRPPVDWVADSPDKALRMAKAMLRIAKARKPGYKHLEIEANDDKLPISAKVPAITMNNDEIAELFSPKARRDPILREVGDIIVQIVELGRAVACNAENAALRVTQDVISEPQIIKQAGLKIALKADETELAYMLGWNDKASPEDAPYAGCGFMKIDDEPSRPFKVYRIKPEQIGAIVAATANLHPELDDLSRKAAGEDYENRWGDTDHLFGGPAPAPAPVVAEADPPQRTGVTDGWGTKPAGGDAQAAIDEAEAVRRRLHDAMNEASDRDPDLDQQFRDILAGGGATWSPPTTDSSPPVEAPQDGKDARRGLVFDIVAGSGAGGVGPQFVQDAFARLHPQLKAPHVTVIARWLDADPRIHKPAYGKYAVRPDNS